MNFGSVPVVSSFEYEFGSVTHGSGNSPDRHRLVFQRSFTMSSTQRLDKSPSLTLLRSRLRALLDAYLRHRPTFQRFLTAGFILYGLGSTYLSVTGRGAKGGARERPSRRKGESLRVLHLC